MNRSALASGSEARVSSGSDLENRVERIAGRSRSATELLKPPAPPHGTFAVFPAHRGLGSRLAILWLSQCGQAENGNHNRDR